MIYEKKQGDYLFSTDKTLLNAGVIHTFLSEESYWAKHIPLTTVIKSIEGSVCFGVYHNNEQIGFARVITDFATFGYLADVFIIKSQRGKGLSKELISFIMACEPLRPLRRFMLATKDAHALYTQFGFQPLSEPQRFMEIKPFESYPH